MVTLLSPSSAASSREDQCVTPSLAGGASRVASTIGTSSICWVRLGGLHDRPKPGRTQQIDEVPIVLATLEAPPARLGVRHWSSRLLAAELGLSHVTIAKVWKKWSLAPWRVETITFSTDPELDAKVRDVVGCI